MNRFITQVAAPFAAICAALLLSACAYQAAEIPSPAAPAAYSNAPAGKAPPPVTLAGEWDLLLLDDAEIEGELHFVADEAGIWWTPTCARQGRTYRIEGERIALGPLEPGSACRIGLPPQLSEVMAALDAVDSVQSAPAGAIRLYGGGHVVLLVPHLPDGE